MGEISDAVDVALRHALTITRGRLNEHDAFHGPSWTCSCLRAGTTDPPLAHVYENIADVAFAAGVAEGRRQAARQIIARDEAEGDWDINVAYWVAVRIAEGTDDA